MEQNIRLEAYGLEARYLFEVDPADRYKLDNQLDRSILAIRYLRDKGKLCSFNFVDPRDRSNMWVVEELFLGNRANSTQQWYRTEESTIDLDFSSAEKLPKDFPLTLTEDLAEKGGFLNLFKSRCPNFKRKLDKQASVYMEVRLDCRIIFNITIGENDKFDISNVTVMRDWDQGINSQSCWRLGLIYNGQYIPASSVVSEFGRHWLTVLAFNTQARLPIKRKITEYDGVEYEAVLCEEVKLPFIDDMLSLANSK